MQLKITLEFDETLELTEKFKNQRVARMRFKDLPKGTRFKYPDSEDIWIVLKTHGNGLIVKWEGLEPGVNRSHCCFVDKDWTLESEVDVIC